jgi:hypothetical protein
MPLGYEIYEIIYGLTEIKTAAEVGLAVLHEDDSWVTAYDVTFPSLVSTMMTNINFIASVVVG